MRTWQPGALVVRPRLAPPLSLDMWINGATLAIETSMFWRKKSTPRLETPERCGHALFEFLLTALKDKKGRIRAEDVISAAASIVGERCIEAAGDFNPREHSMAPGSRVFSTKMNELLCGDVSDADVTAIPGSSVFGMLRDHVMEGKYVAGDFPPLKSIFQHFAASVGNTDEWGKAPLSVAEDNQPFLMPLRVAFETRKKVDQLFEGIGFDAAARLQAAVLALAEVLNAVEGVIDHRIALNLALETVNAMAKTAPMTDAAMAEVAKKRDRP